MRGDGNLALLSQEESSSLKKEQNIVADLDISSVITQVTKRDSLSPTQHINPFNTVTANQNGRQQQQQQPSQGKQPSKTTWEKVRFLFCCFAPTNNGYLRTNDLASPANGTPRAAGFRTQTSTPLVTQSARIRSNLIGPKSQEDTHKKTLVLDLDETLVHSSFKPIPSPDYVLPVEIDGKLVDVYVLKRPWLDFFMESIGHRYEVVVFTASLAKYADPLLDMLDKWKVVRWRLFREACMPYEGNYVKDLSCLGRELQDVIIVDNSPHSYVFQPANALPISTFIDNMEDQELLDLLPVLQQTECVQDVRPVLSKYARLATI